MKKFQFRLKTISRVRKLELDWQARRFALAKQAVLTVKQEIEALEKSYFGELNRLTAYIEKFGFSLDEVRLSEGFREGLRKTAIEKRRELRELEWKAEQERQKLVERQKKKKALDRYEETERERYEEELRKAERKEVDDMAIRRFIRPDTSNT